MYMRLFAGVPKLYFELFAGISTNQEILVYDLVLTGNMHVVVQRNLQN
jgi:hypothetical protein